MRYSSRANTGHELLNFVNRRLWSGGGANQPSTFRNDPLGELAEPARGRQSKWNKFGAERFDVLSIWMIETDSRRVRWIWKPAEEPGGTSPPTQWRVSDRE